MPESSSNNNYVNSIEIALETVLINHLNMSTTSDNAYIYR
jgi:hypothetical protein